MSKICIVWFRQDLRLIDNPALYEASKKFDKIIPVYIHDEKFGGNHAIGAASKWWLHNSLASLSKDIELIIKSGEATAALKEIIKETGASALYFNRCYEPFALKRDAEIEKIGIEVQSFNGSLLFEPKELSTGKGDYYKVFTPFWKACLNKGISKTFLPKPKLNIHKATGIALDSLNLLPKKPDWSKGFKEKWQCGEKAAIAALDAFIENGLSNYAEGRNFPSLKCVSEMSPRLHFGEISPLYIWHTIQNASGLQTKNQANVERYLAELGWREFSYHLLYHFPKLAEQNFKPQFDDFKWNTNLDNFSAWKKGLTGYPIVDAGMRELWHTGYMHNRVRMIVASFLIKDLLIDWRQGEQWFWDTLVDADMASNSASWQWVAGSGADAAPYFRIFNPTLQSEKFDSTGAYIKKWVPELKSLDSKFIHAPWETPPMFLADAGITLGKNYPFPIVDHNKARALALKYYKDL